MHPILFTVGPFTVYSYGVMVALGFAVATACAYMRAPRFGVDRDRVVDLMVGMLVSGIVGARLLYVLQNLAYYRANPAEIIDLSKGGLVWYGGFLAALGTAVLFIRARKIGFWAVTDVIAPYIALAQAMGRLGCFLNGCCYGVSVSPDFALALPLAHDGAWHHPTQIYSALALLAIFAILRIWQDRRRFEGEIFLGYCMLYSLKRLLIEFVRGDNPRIFAGLTLSQLISCVVLVSSAAVFYHMVKRWKTVSAHSK